MSSIDTYWKLLFSYLCKLENGVELVIAVIYLVSTQNVEDIDDSEKCWTEYCKEIAQWIGHDFHRFSR